MAANKIEPLHILQNKQHLAFQSSARALGDVFAAIEPLTISLNKAVETKFEDQLSLAAVHFDLFDNWTVNGEAPSDEYLASLPVPGSIEGHVTGNKPFDIYYYKDLDGNKQRGSYWDGVRDRHPFVIGLRKQIEGVEALSIPAYEKKSTKADLQSKLSTFNNKLRSAVALFFKMQEANEELGSVVEVGYAEKAVLNSKGEPVIDPETKQVKTEINRTTPRLIIVRDLARQKEGIAEAYTIPNFLRLNVEIAKANGGTYAAFIKSNARGTPEEEQPVEQAKIDSPVAFESNTATMLHFLNGAKQSHNSHLFKSLLAHYSGAGSDDRLQTLANLRDQIDVVLGMPQLKARVEAFEMGTKAPPAEEAKAA